MVKALGEIVKIVSGLEKKSKSSDCYYQHQILFFNSLTTYHFFYLLLYTPYIFSLPKNPKTLETGILTKLLNILTREDGNQAVQRIRVRWRIRDELSEAGIAFSVRHDDHLKRTYSRSSFSWKKRSKKAIANFDSTQLGT